MNVEGYVYLYRLVCMSKLFCSTSIPYFHANSSHPRQVYVAIFLICQMWEAYSRKSTHASTSGQCPCASGTYGTMCVHV